MQLRQYSQGPSPINRMMEPRVHIFMKFYVYFVPLCTHQTFHRSESFKLNASVHEATGLGASLSSIGSVLPGPQECSISAICYRSKGNAWSEPDACSSRHLPASPPSPPLESPVLFPPVLHVNGSCLITRLVSSPSSNFFWPCTFNRNHLYSLQICLYSMSTKAGLR